MEVLSSTDLHNGTNSAVVFHVRFQVVASQEPTVFPWILASGGGF
jgi:hypothetical protein